MFVVRVELKNVPEYKAREVYESFHVAMEKAGFRKKVQASDQKWYRLPDATYCTSAGADAASVRTAASTVADATGYKSALIVFGWTGVWASMGLEEVPTSSSPWANA